MDDFMDIGGYVPIGDGRFFLERATGRIFEMTEDDGLRYVDPEEHRLDDEDDEESFGYDKQN